MEGSRGGGASRAPARPPRDCLPLSLQAEVEEGKKDLEKAEAAAEAAMEAAKTAAAEKALVRTRSSHAGRAHVRSATKIRR